MFALTIDYEIAGDGNGSFYNDVILPTYRLLMLLKKYNYKATFFIEVEEIIALKRNRFNGLYKNITKQLKEIHSSGHEFGLHIHPQFSGAKYDEKKGGFWIYLNQILKEIALRTNQNLITYQMQKKFSLKY